MFTTFVLVWHLVYGPFAIYDGNIIVVFLSSPNRKFNLYLPFSIDISIPLFWKYYVNSN